MERYAHKRKTRGIAKLLHLKMKVFVGDPIQWPRSWVIFQAAIDSDEGMDIVVKFSNLKAYLEGIAVDAIPGLETPTLLN